MTRVRTQTDGSAAVESRAYRLELAPHGRSALLTSPAGDAWLSLRLFAACDRTDAPDETLELQPPRVVESDAVTVEVERRSTVWTRAGLAIVCGDERLEAHTWVEGRGDLADVHLLGGRSLLARAPLGFMPSGTSFRGLFTPNP